MFSFITKLLALLLAAIMTAPAFSGAALSEIDTMAEYQLRRAKQYSPKRSHQYRNEDGEVGYENELLRRIFVFLRMTAFAYWIQ